MDKRAQKVLVNAAVCTYAILGFALSVFASLFSALGPRNAPKPITIPRKKRLVPHGRPSTRSLRICSDKTFPSSRRIDNNDSTPEDRQRRKKLLAAHRRSRSIPIITLDYFGSTEDLHAHDSDAESHAAPKAGTLPVRKPLTFVIPPPPERIEHSHDTEKAGFRLASLFSAKEKENRQKIRERKPSTPFVVSEDETKRHPRKRRMSEGAKLPLASRGGRENTVSRKTNAHGAAEEKLTMRFDLTLLRTVPERKKSSTLRTQPYEAPFFCPPPTQRLPRKSQSTLDLTSKSLKKPSSLVKTYA